MFAPRDKISLECVSIYASDTDIFLDKNIRRVRLNSIKYINGKTIVKDAGMNGFEQYVLFQLLRDIKMCQIAKATPGFKQ